jgi:hypothetical protein
VCVCVCWLLLLLLLPSSYFLSCLCEHVGLILLFQDAKKVPKNLKHLKISRNFEKKSKLRTDAFQSFTGFLNSHDSRIESLEIQGSASKGQLKSDLIQIVTDLMASITIKSLDVSGNAAGPSLSFAFEKFLQVNVVLLCVCVCVCSIASLISLFFYNCRQM